MKITKRQLKRIIQEEYTGIERQRILNENKGEAAYDKIKQIHAWIMKPENEWIRKMALNMFSDGEAPSKEDVKEEMADAQEVKSEGRRTMRQRRLDEGKMMDTLKKLKGMYAWVKSEENKWMRDIVVNMLKSGDAPDEKEVKSKVPDAPAQETKTKEETSDEKEVKAEARKNNKMRLTKRRLQRIIKEQFGETIDTGSIWIEFARAYSSLGTAVQDQVDAVVGAYINDATISPAGTGPRSEDFLETVYEQNPNAIEMALQKLRYILPGAGPEAEEILQALEAAEKIYMEGDEEMESDARAAGDR